jgi:hypothetical protein
VSIVVGPAPHEPQRAQTYLIEFFERARIGAQVLGALEVQDCRHDPFAQTPLELIGCPYDPQSVSGLQPEQAFDEPVGEVSSVVGVEGRGIRDLVAILSKAECRLLVPAVVFRVGDVAGEESAAKASLAGPWQVDVPQLAALENERPCPRSGRWRLSNVSLWPSKTRGRLGSN